MITERDVSAAGAVLQDTRETIVQAMAHYIARPGRGTPTEKHDKVAAALFDATLATFTGASLPIGLPEEIDREAIIRFGDGLLPILKDTVGPDLPGTPFSRLSDAYWQTINRIGMPAA
jgi:hypothetical protein